MTTAWSAKMTVAGVHAPAFEAMFDGLTQVVSLFEAPGAGPDDASPPWTVEGLFAGAPPRAELTARLGLIASSLGVDEPGLEIAPVPAKDWLTASVAGFPPLTAGRFYIHGDHISGPYPAGKRRLTVNAATAFGSGEHASTYGCLLALDGLARRARIDRALDMGCGSGILALAIAKVWRATVLAADIDPEAVRVTRANAQANGVAGRIAAVVSEGAGDRRVGSNGPYPLITANILARPLRAMSRDLARLLAPGGTLILAGLLQRQEAMVLTAYRAQGLRLVRRIVRRPWSILVLKR